MSVVRSPLFVVATALLLLAAGFRFDDTGVHGFWADRPIVPMALVLVAVALYVVQAVRVAQRR